MTAPAGSEKPPAAGDDSPRARNLQDLDFLVEKITANYAGYPTKVTDANRDSLANLTSRLRQRAATAREDELEGILREWLGFFRDGHLSVSRIAGAGPDAGLRTTGGAAASGDSTLKAIGPRRDWTEVSVKERLSQLGDRRDPIEGIWETDAGLYRMAVLRTDEDGGAFVGVLLSTTQPKWSPGQEKAAFSRVATGAVECVYRMGDHSPRSLRVRTISGGTILAFGEAFSLWVRAFPEGSAPADLDRLIPARNLFLRRLSPKTLWLRLPDFGDSRYEPLRKLLADSAAVLEATDNLVIDMRNNGGGSDVVYEPVFRFLYTRPIYAIEVELRATQDNIATRRKLAANPEVPSEIREEIRRQSDVMAAHPGEFVSTEPRGFVVETYDTVLPYPRRVVVLIDGAGSSGEQFLLAARQSHKVTLFGRRNSAGVLDFANVAEMPTTSGRFLVRWAISRSMRLPADPVDPDGIAPDIRIPAEVEDPVGYAQAWLERQVD